jgi:hypothetical protein
MENPKIELNTNVIIKMGIKVSGSFHPIRIALGSKTKKATAMLPIMTGILTHIATKKL